MLSTLHTILLFGFVSVTLLLMLMTLINWMRVRRVVMYWHRGNIFGMPVWPLLFMATVLGLFTYAMTATPSPQLGLFGGYLVGGSFWFVSALLTATVVVTDYGIITNVNRAGEAIAWGQIVDYFEKPDTRHTCFTFFYQDERGKRQRYEIAVPNAYVTRFRLVVQAKLDARFEFPMKQVYGKKTLEG